MITEYHRPKTLEEALALLSRTEVDTAPMGGGSTLKKDTLQPLAVVDLQALGLNTIQRSDKVLILGATVTLQELIDTPEIPPALYRSAQLETTYNLRQVATVAGVLVAADGRSSFTTALLALDADLTLLPGNVIIGLGDLLPLRAERLRKRLITQISLPLNARLAYEYVARTPADRPLVCAALAQWPSGRTRLALGGYGSAPILAMDGPEPGGVETAARAAYSQAGDKWASAEYRTEIAGVLARRGLESLMLVEPALHYHPRLIEGLPEN